MTSKLSKEPLRVIAYGGGVQSTALLVLAAQGKLDFQFALFANVGDDSEHPDTLDYVRDVARPWAEAQAPGVDVFELKRRPTRGRWEGKVETLWGRLMHPESRSTGLPVRLSNGAPAGRACTADFKVDVMRRWRRAAGAHDGNPAIVALGISTDEWHRAGNGKEDPDERRVYPLLDLDMSRQDCANVIKRAGLPVPPKSACFFCPYHSKAAWAEMRRDRPDLFEKSVLLEETINERQDRNGMDRVWFTSDLIPLNEAIPVAQPTLFSGADWLEETGECDEGYCFI